MPSIFTSLNLVALTATPNVSGSPAAENLLARLKTGAIQIDNEQVDAGGAADRYELLMNVKQGQKVDFTVFQLGETAGSGGEPVSTNLEVGLWTLGGTAYLGALRGGHLEVTTLTKEGSPVASAYRYPVATRTKVQLTTDKMVISTTPFMSTLASGAVTSFDVLANITFGGVNFQMPMTLKSGKHSFDREELQMEKVVMTGRGTPTSPSDNSLLGNILLGNSQVVLAIDTGAGQYETGGGLYALITKLSVRIADAAVTEIAGTFVFQGGLTYATG